MPLTDAKVRNAKSTGRPAKLSDGGGLHVLVAPTGSKLWRLAYRFAGKQKTLAIGAYPTVTLEMARTARGDAKRSLAEGVDPGDLKRAEKLRSKSGAANTFRVVSDEYVNKMEREGRAPATMAKTKWLIDMANSRLGMRPVTEISSAEVLAVLKQVERRGRLETARRLRSTIGRVFRYAIATARAENDPTVALRGALVAPKVQHRAAVTDPIALGGLLRAIDGFDGQPTTRAALQLMPLLFPRPGELRAAEWREFDLDDAIWRIPAERTKMRREHLVPLAPQATEILRNLRLISTNDMLVLPSVRSARRPMSENTLNAALRRMGYAKDEVTAHGFRATASTMLNESGFWSSDVIERQLGHIDKNDVRRAYARGEYWNDRIAMMGWWANFLDDTKNAGQVVPFPKDAASITKSTVGARS